MAPSTRVLTLHREETKEETWWASVQAVEAAEGDHLIPDPKAPASQRGPVLISFDGSPASSEAVKWTCKNLVCPANNDGVILCYIIEYSDTTGPDYIGLAEPNMMLRAYAQRRELADKALETAEPMLLEAAKYLSANGVYVEMLVAVERTYQTAADALQLIALSHNARAIVVGRSGKSWIARTVLGSTSGTLARQSPVAVIVVPPPADNAKEDEDVDLTSVQSEHGSDSTSDIGARLDSFGIST